MYRGYEPVGFVMLSWNPPAGRYQGRYFLWRLLIDKRYQRCGIGRQVLTSYWPGEGEPWPFYQHFGFEPTGEIDDGEIMLRLSFSAR